MSALTTIASVLLGAALTYWMNVRTRRRTAAEDTVDAAIAAVALVEVNSRMAPQIVLPEGIDDTVGLELYRELALAAIAQHNRRGGEAREALARVFVLDERVRPYYLDEDAVYAVPEEIVALLRVIKADVIGRRRRFRLSRR